jgi:hypothetical protein
MEPEKTKQQMKVMLRKDAEHLIYFKIFVISLPSKSMIDPWDIILSHKIRPIGYTPLAVSFK